MSELEMLMRAERRRSATLTVITLLILLSGWGGCL